MSRIEMTDTPQDVVVKMCDGNPGAINAMMAMLAEGGDIDPQGMFGGLGNIMLLDTWEIYGSSIYVLYSDKCDRDVRKWCILMRACQLGHLSHDKVKAMAEDQRGEVDLTAEEWVDIEKKVLDTLVDFQRAS